MSEVKRYEVTEIFPTYHKRTEMLLSDEGCWVDYEDYATLKAERDALATENANLKHLLSVIAETGNANFGRTTLYTPATDAYLNSVRAELMSEGYVIVPQQMHLSADAMESLCFHCGDGGFAFGDFTDGLLWVGDIENDDGTKTYGLNIATAEYPEEGSANVSEFAAQLRAGKGGE